ncbi:ubiquinol-cytochrome C chaperone family protein [Novosphingobium sp. NPDC080210]|uniref:ubiquinol-cytochrome C chaperone family protein n=1 Tax=Novosphingobium sp. NPDC080210 TaxID=3390596 RepID=UPI003CFD3450
MKRNRPAMSLFNRLLGRPDPGQEQIRPLWHKVVELARDPDWYARGGVADTVPGRFDAITLVLALVMRRMDGQPELRAPSARLTELFVSDMDGQLRQSGVGDLAMAKRMGKLMSVLAGRMEALEQALAQPDDAELIAVIERNVTLNDGADVAAIAARVRQLAARLAAIGNDDLLTGRIAA